MTYTDRVFDLWTPEALANPHPILAEMREHAPVIRLDHQEQSEYPWLLTRYDDAVSLLKDNTRFTKDLLRKPGAVFGADDPMAQAAMSINRHMLTVDPPDHTRLRGLVHKVFTPRMIRRLEGRIQQIADELTERVLPAGKMDLMADYAVPLPVTVIADLLGVPHADQDKFRRWSQAVVLGSLEEGSDPEQVGIAALEFVFYFHDLFDQRRAEPQDDLISALVQVEEDGDRLDQQELVSMVFLLLVAGHETTVNLIGNGMLALLNHRDQMELLAQKPDLITDAIEEMLRYDGPVGTSTLRWALEDIELHGQTIPAGDMVLASLLAANRDPSFVGQPNVFDITREPGNHLAFGSGIHYCLGAPLARLEGAIAINTLLRRFPRLELAVNQRKLRYNRTILLHGMQAMPVRF